MDTNYENKFFCSETQRLRYERFARTITRKKNLNLLFSQNTCTDGNNIEINPFIIFNYVEKTIDEICKIFKMSSDIEIVTVWYSMASVFHECGHIFWSDFDVVSKNTYTETAYGQKIFHSIFNIIEDRYIESRLKSTFKGSKKYIVFSNELAYQNRMSLSDLKDKNLSEIDLFLEYFTQRVILDRVKGDLSWNENSKLLETIKKCEPLFMAASCSLKPEVRLDFVKEIYSIIKKSGLYNDKEPLAHQSYSNHNKHSGKPSSSTPKKEDKEEFSDASSMEEALKEKKKMDKKSKSKRNSDESQEKTFDVPELTEEEFSDLLEEIKFELDDISAEKQSFTKKEVTKTKSKRSDVYPEYSERHKKIIVKNKKPEEENTSRYMSEYIKIYNSILPLINSTVRQFKKWKDKTEDFDRKLPIGDALDTKNLADKDGLVWKESKTVFTPAKPAITVLVDGSGSTNGKLMESMKETCVLLYEACYRAEIPISIIEERAIPYQNVVTHNIKIDYESNYNLRFNIASLRSEGNTREGVSLLYAYEYAKKFNAEKNILIVLSDGLPVHNEYVPPFSQEDTKKVARKIQNRAKHNFSLVAFSLGEGSYTPLKSIYKTVIEGDKNNLPKQVVRIVQRELFT